MLAIAVAVFAPYAAWTVWGQGLTFTGFMATGAGLATAAASGFASGMVGSGGDVRAGLIGAATAVGALGIGSAFGEAASFGKVIAHGVNGGLSTMAQGGKFAHGFLSSGFTEAFAPGIRAKFSSSAGQAAAAAVVGGTASAIGGGKFANGAVTGAFSYAFNTMAHGRPSSDRMDASYPKDASGADMYGPDVYKMVGEEVGAMAKEHGYENACALRVSIALNDSGVLIPNVPGTFQGGDGRNYFLGAGNLEGWLTKTFLISNDPQPISAREVDKDVWWRRLA